MSGSSVRALARIAWRDIGRHRGRSVLVALLILLPVAAMVGSITILRTTAITPEREDVARMGRADLEAQGVSKSEVAKHLPDGSLIEPTMWSDASIVTAGARPLVSVRGLDLAGLAQGMFVMVDGRLPSGPAEVVVTAKVLELADTTIGGHLVLDDAAPVSIVGLVENPLNLGDRVVIVDPHAVPPPNPDLAAWLIDVPEGADPEAIVAATTDPETGAQEFLLRSRRSGQLQTFGGDTSPTILIFGTLALVEAALVASAAFAVSIRRRQRELGLLAATGATPRQLAGTVLAEAAILGLGACLGGVVVGLGGALALTPVLDQLTQHRNPPLVVDTAGIVGPIVIGFVAAIIAAIVPARTVARVPVLLSLSGRRPPEQPARRSLGLGLATVAVSVLLVVLGGNAREGLLGAVRELLVLGGAVLGTLGFGACGPWLLERLEGLALRLPLASRIAFRETARSRSRSSPIVTAVLASLAATITLGTWVLSRDAANAAEWRPYLYPEVLAIRWSGAQAAGEEIATWEDVELGAPIIGLEAPSPGHYVVEAPDALAEDGEPFSFGIDGRGLTFDRAALGTPELLRIAGAAEALPALEAGKAVVIAPLEMTADSVEVAFWDDPGAAEASRRIELPAVVVNSGVPGGILAQVLLPQSVADELDLTPAAIQEYLIRFDRPVTEADVMAAATVAARYPETYADAALGPQRPDHAFRILLIGLALLFAISVTGVAIALGEAESRPEQRSLLALGADPKLRRRIAASRAAVLALLAGILAVPAGLLPAWGLLTSFNAIFVLPWLEVGAALVVLPVLAILAAWFLSRPIPDWNAFRSVGAGE